MDNFLAQVRQEINDWLEYVRAKREVIRNRLVKYVDQDKDDDKIGVNTIYSSSSRPGIISGRIIGGSPSSYVGIFGTHVQAISEETHGLKEKSNS